MTDQQINIAIAECCGWTKNETASIRQWERKNEWCQNLPNYTSDLNAMHKAESTLSDYETKDGGCQQDDYALELLGIVGLHKAKHWGEECEADFFRAAHASARQRAEAFLRTLGKWKE